MERRAKSAKAKVKARPTVTKKSRQVDTSTAPELKQRLAEALEQHAAISEILQVISASPSDVQPVLDAVAERAARLCEAPLARVLLVDGDVLRLTAEYSLDGAPQAGTVPLPLRRSSISGRAVLDRATIHHDDVVPLLDSEYPDALNARRLGIRAALAVPLMRQGNAYGAIFLWRREPGLFSSSQVALVETFAQQVAIAIHNVRLFNETKEALEQQTAISEILRVIANSPGDVRPMLNVVAERAMYLCDAADATIFLREGDRLRSAARFGSTPTPLDEGKFMPLTRGSVTGRAVIDRSVFHMEDLATASQEEFPVGRELQRHLGHHTALSVPLMREDRAIGAIALWRMETRRFTDTQIALVKTFADQAVIAIENVRLFDEVQARTSELSESLQQQTATADVLKVISRSAFDLQKVLDTLTESAYKLCDAEGANIWRPDGDGFKMAATFGQSPEHMAALKQVVNKPGRATCVGRALLEGRTVHIRDAMADPEYNAPGVLAVRGNRTMIGVPLLREGAPIGVLVLTRTVARPFTEQQIALATTFADQAVIAIENVRLFNETKEALEQQTATSEILRVISSSPTDIRPVLDTVAECAARLCGSSDVAIFRRDGDRLRLVAHYGQIPTSVPVGEFTLPLVHASVNGRAMLSGQTVHIADVQAETKEFPVTSEIARQQGSRTWLSVPMLREGVAIGSISLRRTKVELFADRQVALLQTFADQAVIAIENVRLFNETKEALERQTATAEILQVIGSSPTDTQPVFDAIVNSGVRLFPGAMITVARPDAGTVRAAAIAHEDTTMVARWRERFTTPLSRDRLHAAAILDAKLIDFPDAEAEKDGPLGPGVRNFLLSGNRAVTIMPMLRGEGAIGAISVTRAVPGPLSDKQIAILRTFADQAAIAIENVRLFKELQARTEALTRSVGQLTALGEVGHAISSTLDLETVLKTIVSRAVQLTGLDGGSIYEYDERAEEFRLQAAENMPQDIAEDIRKAPTRKGDGALGRTAITLEPTQVPDTLDDSYQSVRKELLIRAGYRALLAVPLLREDHLLGGLLVNRNAPGEFAPEVVELLKTFATQSALAIQNARLFREIAEKGRQLEAASRHKSDFLASMSHELRTPLNAILGFNEMILGEIYGEVPASMKEPLADIQTSGKHLLRLINNVLDLAKIEAGRMELALADYSAQDTVESVRAALRPLAADKGLEFVATVPADLPLAYGDSGRITQCLMNLAGNSLKFTRAGKVEISVEAKGDLLVYKVADTGIGIPPDKVETVFAEFKQTDATIASEYGGTGLGLSISRKFIEMHGGRIWVESELGRGSTFIFEIPLRVSTGAPA